MCLFTGVPDPLVSVTFGLPGIVVVQNYFLLSGSAPTLRFILAPDPSFLFCFNIHFKSLTLLFSLSS